METQIVNDREYIALKEISSKMDDLIREMREIKVRMNDISK